MCRAMVEDAGSRVDFAMAEALAFGTLATHRSASLDATEDAAAGLNWGVYTADICVLFCCKIL